MYVKNAEGEASLLVYVMTDGSVVPKNPEADTAGFDMTEVYCPLAAPGMVLRQGCLARSTDLSEIRLAGYTHPYEFVCRRINKLYTFCMKI